MALGVVHDVQCRVSSCCHGNFFDEFVRLRFYLHLLFFICSPTVLSTQSTD